MITATETVALRMLSRSERFMQAVKNLRYVLFFWRLRRERQAAIDAVTKKHLRAMRDEGKVIQETSDGWTVTFNTMRNDS